MSNLTHSDGYGTGTGNATLLANPELCTLQTCDLSMASFLYLPTIGGNATFAAIFGICLIWQLYLGIRHKVWGYMVAMVFGLVLEIIGYAARIMLHDSPFSNNDFLMYLIVLTIAPAFFTAAIYLCLARIVTIYGENLSRFRPRTYTLVFCGCDVVSLVLQALGGGIAAGADSKSSSDLGKNIMIAGLGFQVFSIVLFSALCLEFAWRVRKYRGAWNPKHIDVVKSRLFEAFLCGLVVAVVTIFARSVYRCVELSGGFNGTLFVSDEVVFMILEGTMIAIACITLTALHPVVCFQGSWHEADFKFRPFRVKKDISRKTIDEESQMSNVQLQTLRNDSP